MRPYFLQRHLFSVYPLAFFSVKRLKHFWIRQPFHRWRTAFHLNRAFVQWVGHNRIQHLTVRSWMIHPHHFTSSCFTTPHLLVQFPSWWKRQRNTSSCITFVFISLCTALLNEELYDANVNKGVCPIFPTFLFFSTFPSENVDWRDLDVCPRFSLLYCHPM